MKAITTWHISKSGSSTGPSYKEHYKKHSSVILTIGSFTNSKMTNPNTEMPSHTQQSPLNSKNILTPGISNTALIVRLSDIRTPVKDFSFHLRLDSVLIQTVLTQNLETAESGWLISFVRRTSVTHSYVWQVLREQDNRDTDPLDVQTDY